MIVLDTNIVSEMQKPRPDRSVTAWLAAIDFDQSFICGPVLLEQAYGAERHFLRQRSERYRKTLADLRDQFKDRTLAMTGEAFEIGGVIRVRRENAGRPISLGDAMIAAICIAHGATLATRNVRDFDGLDLALVNPFEAA